MKLYRIFTASLLMLVFVSSGCNKPAALEALFNYAYLDGNKVQFTNESIGDYYSATWDFGNGTKETTTDKKKSYEIYYPNAGDVDVSLKILDYAGLTDIETKTINIAENDIVVSFTAVIDPDSLNYVKLTNTSTGEYTSFKWIYRSMEIEGEMNHKAYFPKEGIYEIELQVYKNTHISSLKKSVTIAQDDPGYIEGMSLIWSDEFDGATISSANWTFETGATGWGNSELQNYTNGDNAEIVDGKLIITARKVNEDNTVGSYTSSRLITKGKNEFQYGRMEIRAKLPSGRGTWPAIWMLGSNISSVGWPACGEMDIMEYVGYEPNTIHSTVHTTSGSGVNGDGSSKTLTSCEEEFHIYGMIWDEQELKFYTDTPDNVTHTYAPPLKTVESWPFDQSAFFILNLAIGGSWGGAQGVDPSIFPQSLEVDYVRVYQEAVQ
ncbi:family 16 glycosylhydrolase [Bacteroidota bacterium]